MHRVFTHKVIFYLFILFIFDLTLAPLLRIGQAQPVFSYLMILYGAFHWEWRKILPLALTVGLMRDLVSSPLLGAETVSLAAVAILLDGTVQKIERRSLVMRTLSTFLFISGVLFVNFFVTGIFGGHRWNSQGSSLGLIFAISAYSTLWMPFFFFVTSAWFRDRPLNGEYRMLHSR